MPAIGLIDVSGIQNAIFRSPELKEIAKVSEAIEHLSNKDGLFRTEAGECFLFSAGGNLALRAEQTNSIKAIVRKISRTLLEDYPGLDISVAVCDYEPGKLALGYKRAIKELEKNKLTRAKSVRFDFPGLKKDDDWRIGIQNIKDHDGEPDLDKIICNIYRVDSQVSDKPVQEKTDLMAVVSIDGLGMGKRIIQWMSEMEDKPDQEFIDEFRAWSESIRTRWDASWDMSVKKILANFKQINGDIPIWQHPFQSRYLTRTHNSKPFRHIYQGGDDLSFVCAAPIALDLTREIITHLETPVSDVNPIFESIQVSAGILFVGKKYPFGRAVQLAEAVRKKAKLQSASDSNKKQPNSALSWWVNRQGEVDMPEPLYGGASQKPYLLHEAGESISLDILLDDVMPTLWNEFSGKPSQSNSNQAENNDDSVKNEDGSRSLFKSLLAAAEVDPHGKEVERLLVLRSEVSKVDANPFRNLPTPYNSGTGFGIGRQGTLLLDAGELFDLYFPLKGAE